MVMSSGSKVGVQVVNNGRNLPCVTFYNLTYSNDSSRWIIAHYYKEDTDFQFKCKSGPLFFDYYNGMELPGKCNGPQTLRDSLKIKKCLQKAAKVANVTHSATAFQNEGDN